MNLLLFYDRRKKTVYLYNICAKFISLCAFICNNTFEVGILL